MVGPWINFPKISRHKKGKTYIRWRNNGTINIKHQYFIDRGEKPGYFPIASIQAPGLTPTLEGWRGFDSNSFCQKAGKISRTFSQWQKQTTCAQFLSPHSSIHGRGWESSKALYAVTKANQIRPFYNKPQFKSDRRPLSCLPPDCTVREKSSVLVRVPRGPKNTEQHAC